MFDIGWSEFVVIGVVALIAIGPKELPGVLRAVGQWTTKLRRMASEFQNQFQEALREAEMADLKKEVDGLTDSAKGFASGLVTEMEDPLKLKEMTKWEPKVDDTGKPADAFIKPIDVPPTEFTPVTPDGYAANEMLGDAPSFSDAEESERRPVEVPPTPLLGIGRPEVNPPAISLAPESTGAALPVPDVPTPAPEGSSQAGASS